MTGSASGIGRAIAERFAAEGAAVAVADISDPERAEETLRRVRAAGAEGIAVLGDVSDVEDARRIVDDAAAGLGGLDIVVNNAGHFLPPQPVADYDVDSFDRIIAVNLRGPFLIAKYAIPHLLERGGGVLLGIGSVNGIAVWPGDCAYNASKAGHHCSPRPSRSTTQPRAFARTASAQRRIGTEGFQQLLDADDDPDGYLRNTVGLHPMGRIGRPEEIASVAVTLCSDEASFVTGSARPRRRRLPRGLGSAAGPPIPPGTSSSSRSAIGPKTLKNRFYQVPHCNGAGSERPGMQAALREVKAEGGWAAVCTEECSIHPECDSHPLVSARLWDDGDVRNLARTCEAAHRHGALAGVELGYMGAHATGFETRAVPRAPSQIAGAGEFGTTPVEMSREEIGELQDFFVAARPARA